MSIEFSFPLHFDDILSGENNYGFNVTNPNYVTENDSSQIISVLEESTDISDLLSDSSLTEGELNNILFSCMAHYSTLSNEVRSVLVSFLIDTVQISLELIKENNSPVEKNNIKKIIFYFLQLCAINEALLKNSPSSSFSSASAKKGKKKTNESSEELVNWSQRRKQCLNIINLILVHAQLSSLFNMNNIEENLLNKVFFYLLGLIEDRPAGLNGINQAEASLRNYVVSLLGLVLPLLKNAGSSNQSILSTITNSFQESLIKYDHMFTYLVEFCRVEQELKVAQKLSNNYVTVMLLKELSRLNFNNLTGQGVKNIALFIELFSKNCTKIFYGFLPHLIRLIDAPPHQIRSSVIQAMGHVIQYIHEVLVRQQQKVAEAEAEADKEMDVEAEGEGETRATPANSSAVEEEVVNQAVLVKQRDTLLDLLVERTHDVNPYTRSALMKTWISLASSSSLPVKRYCVLVEVGRNRLEDKNYLVRRQALGLLSVLITKNPYASVLNSSVFLTESNKLVKEIEARVEELCQETGGASNLTPMEKKILEITNAQGQSEESQAPLISEEELLQEVNEIELRNQMKNDERMAELKLKLDYINSAAAFIQALEATLPRVLVLLDSKTTTDVVEALSYLNKAVNFQVSGALALFKQSFKLIWHHEEAIVSELLNSFNLIYLTDGACDQTSAGGDLPVSTSKNQPLTYLSSKEISLNLINLVHTCSTNELISLEKILKLTFPEDFDFSDLFQSFISFAKFYYKEINEIVSSTPTTPSFQAAASSSGSLAQNLSTFNRRQSLLKSLAQEEAERKEAEAKLQEEIEKDSAPNTFLLLTDNEELNKRVKNFSSCFYLISVILTHKNADLDFETLGQLFTLTSSDLIFSCGDFFSLKCIVVSLSIVYDKLVKKREEQQAKAQSSSSEDFSRINQFESLEAEEKKFFQGILKNLLKKFFLIFNPRLNVFINFFFSLFEEIIFLVYKVSPEPDEIFEKLIKKLFYLLYYNGSTASDAIQDSENQPDSDDAEKEASQLSTEAISSKVSDLVSSEKPLVNSSELAGFIFILGQVALCTLVQAEELGNSVRKKIKSDIEQNKEEDDDDKEDEEVEAVKVKSKKNKGDDASADEEEEEDDEDRGATKKRKVVKKKAAPKAPKKPVDDFEEQMGMIQAVDAEQELELNHLIEREIVIENLLGQFVPLVKFIVANEGGTFNHLSLRSASVLTLCKCISLSNELCESTLPLLFTVLKDEQRISIRTTIIIALGDISFRFPNLIEPWTKNFFSLLIDSNSIIRYNTLLIISHLLLNDMIKLKGNIINLIICLNDVEIYIQNLVKNFFIKFSERSSNPIYNLLPDVISYFSNEKLIEEFQHELAEENSEKASEKAEEDQKTGESSSGSLVSPPPASFASLETKKKLFLTTPEYEKSIKFLLSFIHKDKQNDLLCERLMIRLRQNESTIGRRRISFSISLLVLSEKFLVKLKEQFKLIRSSLLDDEIFAHFKAMLQKMKLKSRVGSASSNSNTAAANLNANPALASEEAETTGSSTIQKSILEEVEAALYAALNGDEDGNYEKPVEGKDGSEPAEKEKKAPAKASRSTKAKAAPKPAAKAVKKKAPAKKKVESEDDDDDFDEEDD